MGRDCLRWDVLPVDLSRLPYEIPLLRRSWMSNQWNKILDVIKWDTDKDSKNKYAWYRAHSGKKK